MSQLNVLTEQVFSLNPVPNGQQALKNHNLSFTPWKIMYEYSLKRYWIYLHLSCWSPTQILLQRFPKTTLNRFCTEPTILTTKTDINLYKFISQTIQPKLGNKYSLERYWKYLQLSLHNPTQIRHVRSLKMTLNMYYTNWSKNRALEPDSNLQKDITRVLLNEQMHMIALWKGQETYYNIFHIAVNRFDL
jgi:hypothetical protein